MDKDYQRLFADGIPRNWQSLLAAENLEPKTRHELWDILNPNQKFCSCGKERRWRKTAIERIKTCGDSACFQLHKNNKTIKTVEAKYGGRSELGKISYSAGCKTRKAKYGSEAILGSDEAKKKRLLTNEKTYGINCPAVSARNLKSSVTTRAETLKSKFESRHSQIESKLLDRGISVEKFGTSLADTFELRCDCGNKFERPMKHLASCPNCSISAPQKEIKLFVEGLNVAVKSNDRRLIKPYELDVLTDKIAIEVNGAYWHSAFSGISLLEKSNLASQQGIRVLHFFDYEILEKGQIVKSIIAAALGKETQKLNARSYKVAKISAKEATHFFNRTHLAGSAKAKYHFALLDNGKIISALSAGKPRWSQHDLEIIRFSSELRTRVRGAFTKLLTAVIATAKPSTIVSYCDLRIGSGKVYEASGFQLSHLTKPNYQWVRGRTRLSRYETQKHKLSSLLQSFDPELSEKQNLKAAGFHQMLDCGNQCWVLNLSTQDSCSSFEIPF